jgi:uncharacterized protein (DUF58 family)
MDTQELLKKVRKIEIKTRKLSHQHFSGEYHSSFKGRGMSFSEVREYQYGDDVRDIDWNVTARFNHPYVKVFEEERELTTMLVLDVSASEAFGTVQRMKKDLSIELGAVLAFSAIQNNDKVGAIFFTDQIEKFIPPQKGRSHILRIIRELLDFEPDHSGTNLSEAFQYLTRILKKRAITFVISDFIDSGYKNPLTIASRQHDVIGLRLYDPRETELPNAGLVRMRDAETDQVRWVDTASKAVRQNYKKWYEQQVRYFEDSFLRSNADKLSLRTDESYVPKLMNFFKRRETQR